ncbi:MAG: YHYH protein [Aliiglaciecola sp.]|uniref:YHYH protein n=1 Tax=Aliiglaciecola sp. TaxID=1872441 RepID=UPI0032968B14
MNNSLHFMKKTLLCSAILLALSACSGSDTDESETDSSTSNSSPSVDAGSDLYVDEGDTVTLEASVDDDDIYTVNWTQTGGTTTADISDTNSQSISFTAPEVDTDDTLVFTVTVDDGVNEAVSDTVSVIVSDTSTDEETQNDSSVWIINETGELSEHILDSTTGIGVEVNVQSVEVEDIDGKEYTVVTSQGIPNYETLITDDIFDGLSGRPKASSDFVNGYPSVEVGDSISFGEDVGYVSNSNCTLDYGYGYWPPGPECPTQDERTVYLPVEPTPTEEECENGLSKVGIMVNGTSIYNWGDGMSYNSEGFWQTLAPEAELYDVDVCGGHAAGTDYHHHFYSACLAELLGDDGTAHSPLYGYAADGYPIYGPYESNGELAVSAWVLRDYSDPTTTGCSDGARSCNLVDQYDISQGTVEVSDGPGFDDVVLSLSSNEFIAKNGFYYEDYYWDSSLTDAGGVYLDQYNGHYDSERGYHYHITLTMDEDNNISPAFPYIIGTRYAGQLEDNAMASCSTGDQGQGPGPGAGPGG